MAEDHIHFTIGRQAASLKQVSEAVKAFEKLLKASSKQHAVQQAAFLREFLHTRNVSIHGLSHKLILDNLHLCPLCSYYFRKMALVVRDFLFYLCR